MKILGGHLNVLTGLSTEYARLQTGGWRGPERRPWATEAARSRLRPAPTWPRGGTAALAKGRQRFGSRPGPARAGGGGREGGRSPEGRSGPLEGQEGH